MYFDSYEQNEADDRGIIMIDSALLLFVKLVKDICVSI